MLPSDHTLAKKTIKKWSIRVNCYIHDLKPWKTGNGIIENNTAPSVLGSWLPPSSPAERGTGGLQCQPAGPTRNDWADTSGL